jgi:predicted nucleic-acid-binding Zn-ribbon protein
MEDSSDVPLSCPKCGHTTPRPMRWVQENTFVTCSECGATVLIDKDAATKLVAQLQQNGAD